MYQELYFQDGVRGTSFKLRISIASGRYHLPLGAIGAHLGTWQGFSRPSLTIQSLDPQIGCGETIDVVGPISSKGYLSVPGSFLDA